MESVFEVNKALLASNIYILDIPRYIKLLKNLKRKELKYQDLQRKIRLWKNLKGIRLFHYSN